MIAITFMELAVVIRNQDMRRGNTNIKKDLSDSSLERREQELNGLMWDVHMASWSISPLQMAHLQCGCK